MTPSPQPRTVAIEIDGERLVLDGRPAAMLRGVVLAIPLLEARAGEPVRVTFHCGVRDDDVKVEVPGMIYVNKS